MKTRSILLTAAFTVMVASVPMERANAGSEPYLGEIMWTAGFYCPRGYLPADSQLLPISNYEALFSLLGTTYGGDGRTIFGLPDLRGRVPISLGQGPGLRHYRAGEKGGQEQVTLRVAEMPLHNHALTAGDNATTNNPSGSIPGKSKHKIYEAANQADSKMAANTVMNAGNSQAHENRPPYLTIRMCRSRRAISIKTVTANPG
jgi:microcystin-dependent protein